MEKHFWTEVGVSIALLCLWFLLMDVGGQFARYVVYGIAGWQVGGWIRPVARRIMAFTGLDK